MNCDLVIFDCDGVLVDSEPISCRVHADVLTRRGYPITAEQVATRFLGRSGRQTRGEIEGELGRSLGDDFEAELHTELIKAFEASLQPMPFITDALDRVARPVCVASSGTLARIIASLTYARLIDRLAPNLFSAEQVVHGKPAPDLFLFAANRMGVAPAACVVIEDSEPGIVAARAAAMPVLGFTGGSHCGPETAERLRRAGAAAIFADMRQLPDRLAELPAL